MKTSRRTALKAALAVVAGAPLLLAGCSAGSSSAGADGQAVLRWANTFPTNWDPVTSGTGADVFKLSLPYAALTELDADGAATPGLAESWAYNDDGTEVSFTLRPDLTFSDGTPLDAEAVKFHFDRTKTQENSVSKALVETIEEVTVTDPRTVVFHLTQPDFQIPLLLAGRPGQIASKAAAEADVDKLQVWPVGAGPFTITELVPESHAYFERNPDYWDAENIHIDRIELHVATDPATIVSALQTGVYDVADIPGNQVEAARAAGLTVAVNPSLSVSDVSINLNKPPFDDPRVVEALRYAWDRQEFVDKLTFGHGVATNQPFPPDNIAFDPELADVWPYDPERAKQLLADAGYEEGELTVTIHTEGGTFAELIQAQLKRVGIESELASIPPGQYVNVRYVQRAPAITHDGTIGRESPVQSLLSSYGPEGNMNLSAPHASQEFLDALALVRATPLDAPEYQGVLQAAVELGVLQSPSNYLYSAPRIIASRPGVTGIPAIPSNYRWEGVRVDG